MDGHEVAVVIQSPVRVVTYEARDKKAGMTPAEIVTALENAVEVRRYRIGPLSGKLLSLVVVEQP